jgi:hypothetical protein
MLAGLVAGLLGFCFARVVGEPPVNAAIAFESYIEHSVRHQAPEEALVSRPLQSTAGLATGALLYGVSIGGIFALVFAAAYGRLGPLAARGTAALLGCLGFVACYLVPFLKYPANPPSIGSEETIQLRTALYLAMVVASVGAMALAAVLRQRLVGRWGGWDATLIAAGTYLVAMALCFVALPTINEVPQQAIPSVVDAVTDADVTFPPAVLWAFRVASLGLQIVVWSTIALVFGVLAERQLEPTGERSSRREAVRLPIPGGLRS